MTLITILKDSVHPFLFDHINFLKQIRKNLNRSEKNIRIGINYTIILTTACLIEGHIEKELKLLVDYKRRILNNIDVGHHYHRRTYYTFLNRVSNYLNETIGRTTGIENLQKIYELLSFERVPTKLIDFPEWEGIKALFSFRNVLAHGREISAKRVQGPWAEGGLQDYYKGGYKVTEDYLAKKRLVSRKFIEIGSVDHFFTNKVSDHFYSIAKRFLKFHTNLVNQEMQEKNK